MNVNCDFIRIDGTIMPGVAGISVEHDMLRGTVRTLGGRLQVDRLGNAGVSNTWTVQFSGLSEQEKSLILFHVLSNSGVRRVEFFNTAGFDALVSVTRDEYVPRWDVTRTYRQHASGSLTLRVEALALTSPFTTGSVYAELMNSELVFRSGVQIAPSTFTRASQAWDGSGLVPPDTMRVFGRDTKSPVVLIEGQRTNLVPWSWDFAQWSPGGVAVAPPVNGYTRMTITESPFASVYVTGLGAVKGGALTLSVIVRRGTAPAIRLQVRGDSGHLISANFFWADRSFEPVTMIGADPTFSERDLPNGDTLITVTATVSPEQAVGSYQVRLYPVINAEPGGYTDVYSIQLEEAPFASSYIPTDGAPATRARDYWWLDAGFGIESGNPFTLNLAFRKSHMGAIERPFQLNSANGRELASYFTTEGNFVYNEWISGSSPLSALGEWSLLSLVSDGNLMREVVNGSPTGREGPWVPSAPINRIYVASGSANEPINDPFAPGAAQLGIPFIDNRAWSAEEIQAAHARWLPELNKIEVPV